MLKNLRKFYHKANQDYSKGSHVDPLDYHIILYYCMTAFQVLNKPNPWWTYVFKLYATLSNLLGFIITCLAVYHGVEILDIALITEGGCYFIILLYGLFMTMFTTIDLKHYFKFTEILREDFQFIYQQGQRHRVRFFQNQLETWKMCVTEFVFMVLSTLGMAAFQLLYIGVCCMLHWGEEDYQRPILFPFFFFEADVHATPLYEFLFTYASFGVIFYGLCYSFMLQVQIIWIRQMATKADLVIWDLEILLDGIHPTRARDERKRFDQMIKSRMAVIVPMHQSIYSSMYHYAAIYRKLSMYEQKLCGPVVCLIAYSVAEKLETGEVHLILLLLGITAITVCFIPSYLCTFLDIKTRSICEACCDTKFWEAGPIIRPYLVLMMQRSLRPLPLSAPGFEPVSIETFSKKMTAAYQYFNMLRQTKLEL